MGLSTDLCAKHYKKNSKSQYSQASKLLKSLEIGPETSILDVGCGHGEIIAELSKRAPYGRCVGVDPSESMISHACEDFPEALYPNLEFHQLKAEDMAFEEKSFDIIVCTNAFLWIRDPKKALELFGSFLKPGGELVLLSYCKDTPYARLFESTLKKNFPELIEFSAVNTMLELNEYREILVSQNMNIDMFEIEEVIFKYESKVDLENYIRGWLTCYVPFTTAQQELFIKKVIEESELHYLCSNSREIAIPHQTITIKASKCF